MSKKGNNQIFIISGSVLLVGAVVFVVWYVKRRKKKDQKGEDEVVFATVSGSGSSTASSTHHRPGSTKPFRCVSRSYPLQFGTCHPDVMVLQRYLKSLKANLASSGSKRDGVDGKFGSMTQKAAMGKLGKSSFSSTDIKGMKLTLNSK